MKYLKKIIDNPYRVFNVLSGYGLLNWMSDESYLKLLFKGKLGRKLDLINPTTYNEKLQWLKLYDRNPIYTTYVDKYRVRDYVKNTIGEEYLVPLLGVWEQPDMIAFNDLPEQFVLKCNHDSGSIIVCTDKNKLNYNKVKEKLAQHLKKGTFYIGREWPYKDVKPCIIAEQYLEDKKTKELRDYKFFVFDGVVKALFIATDRQTKDKPTAFDFFDVDFNHIDMRHGHPNAPSIPEKPENFELMKELASKLGKNMPQARIDFYEVNGKVYFGEITLFHHSGFTKFDPEDWDTIFGSWIDLSKVEQGS